LWEVRSSTPWNFAASQFWMIVAMSQASHQLVSDHAQLHGGALVRKVVGFVSAAQAGAVARTALPSPTFRKKSSSIRFIIVQLNTKSLIPFLVSITNDKFLMVSADRQGLTVPYGTEAPREINPRR
jgi:hypothetical protein